MTIQEGIDAAVDGDTVVVYPDLYNENILIDKSITLTSLALFDPTTNTISESLDDWILYQVPNYVVGNEYINTTIINGAGEDKSTVTVKGDDCIEPLILGFTIQNGSGTLVDRKYVGSEGAYTVAEHLGGGIISFSANPTINYNKIYNNGVLSDVRTGGAVYSVTNDDDVEYRDSNRDCDNDSFDYRHNFFENNSSDLGRHIGNRFDDVDFDLSNCIFDFWNCQDGGIYQTPVWVNIDNLNNLVAEGEENSGCLMTGDVYVDPVNGNDYLNDGSENSPFYTIKNTLPKVVGTEQNPVTINLAEGTYSPSTNGETFSIELFSHLNLIGQGEDITIIDAEQTGRVIQFEFVVNTTVSDLTITGGSYPGDWGGGVLCDNSSPILDNLIIYGNDGGAHGGGIAAVYDCNLEVTNSIINNNTAISGGGVYLSLSLGSFNRVQITKNSALGFEHSNGGGIGVSTGSTITIENSTIADNESTNPYTNALSVFENFENPGETVANIINSIVTGTILSHQKCELLDQCGGGVVQNGVDNCDGSGDCCCEAWIGDGWADCEDQAYGCDLSCYYNDGGDCDGGREDNNESGNKIPLDNNSQNRGSPELYISYSNIEGGWEGEGNINADPLFTDPGSGDYTLQEGSPCIDAGTADIDGDGVSDMAYLGTAPDMGAYEYGSSSFLSGDLNGDGEVNVIDVVVLVNIVLGGSEPVDAGDMNGDGILNVLDVVMLVSTILIP